MDSFSDRVKTLEFTPELIQHIDVTAEEFMPKLEREAVAIENSINGVIEISESSRFSGHIQVRCVRGVSADERAIEYALQELESRIYRTLDE